MAPTAISPRRPDRVSNSHDESERIEASSRQNKRVKLTSPAIPSLSESEVNVLNQRHPLKIRPSGNAYLAETNAKTAIGRLAILPDELLAQLLEYLDASELLRLGGTSKALHAFTRSEELWKALFTESTPASFKWQGTWRSTYLSQARKLEPVVDCSNVFSDVLHRPFHCTHAPLLPFILNIPRRNEIQRLPNATAEEIFGADRPLILTEPVKQWPVFKENWDVGYLLMNYRDIKFRAEAVDWPLNTYNDYMNRNNDESPLYLFDRSFVEKMGIAVSEAAPAHPTNNSDVAYWPPACFGSDQDLFNVLGTQRPDHRWLIVGPARSGSTFHKDPNGTSAWNAVLSGRKYWIMFPSSSSLPPPPGVHVSADESEVTSPLSIAEWLLTFHAEARAAPGCQEGICHEGEILYVPSGWYHLVLNLEMSVALTQNFVPRHKVVDVLAFLRDKPDQVSGFKGDVEDPYALFVERLREQEPELLEQALTKLAKKDKAVRGRWEEIAKGDEKEEGGFSFGFGGGDDDDEEIP